MLGTGKILMGGITMNTAELKQFCTEVRRDIINMTANAGSGHPVDLCLLQS